MATPWSVTLLYKGAMDIFARPKTIPVVTTSAGAADAGSVPMLGANGKLDASVVPPSVSVGSAVTTTSLSVNGVLVGTINSTLSVNGV